MSTALRFGGLTATVVTAVLALSACSPAMESPQTTPEAAASTPAEVSVIITPETTPEPSDVDPAAVPEKLQFSATTLDGQAFEGASLFGQPTILWFWAEWCPNCNAEAPLIADALDELPAGVQVIGVPGRSGQDGMERFVRDHGLEDMVQVVDADGSLWANFSVASQPAIAIIDAEGNVRTVPGASGKSGVLSAAADIA